MNAQRLTEWFMLTVVPAAMTSCLAAMNGGCAEQQIEDRIAMFEGVSKFMQEQNMVGNVSLTVGGDGSVYLKEAAGLDLDMTLQANVQFNASADALDSAIQPHPVDSP